MAAVDHDAAPGDDEVAFPARLAGRSAGDRGDGCYRVEQGLVRITVTSDWGEERIIALVGTLTLTIRQAMNRSRPIRANRPSLPWTTAQLLSLGGWPDAAV
jgi:hypothetical protein